MLSIDKGGISLELQQRINDCRIELARRDFYQFCRLRDPDFYIDDRIYLKNLCNILQKFLKGELINPITNHFYKKLMIAMPPRHGKTRTLTNFSAWCFGQNPKFKILSSAFADDVAFDFSKYTRDIISEDRNTEDQIIYRDIFPDTYVKPGSAALEKWALHGSYFSYKGAGIGGQITGKGGNLLIIDDPVKDAEMAYNELYLEKVWRWYGITWKSRREHNALEIICHTPWSKKDISGRILESEDKDNWYIYSLPACLDENKKEMLCPSILSYDEFIDLKNSADPILFAANFLMKRIDALGLLYKEFKTYTELPLINSNYYGRKMICDPADKGEDYLCAVYGTLTKDFFFVEDVIYTQEDIDKTEKLIAKRIQVLKIDTAYIEDNGSGHNYAYIIKKELQENLGYMVTQFQGITQSKNKEARIFGNSATVNIKIIFPDGWRYKWPEFYSALTEFSRIGKNKHDDAPDCLTSIVLNVMKGSQIFDVEFRKQMAARRAQQ